MKKLLVVALLAASVVGMAEARHCYRNSCAPCAPAKCEPCHERKAECIGPVRICETTYSNDCSEEPKPELCAVVPAPRHLDRHVHCTKHVSYSCRPLTGCQQRPSQEQLDAWKEQGAIPADCGG